MAGRKTPKDDTTPAEATKATAAAETDKTPSDTVADAPKEAAPKDVAKKDPAKDAAGSASKPASGTKAPQGAADGGKTAEAKPAPAAASPDPVVVEQSPAAKAEPPKPPKAAAGGKTTGSADRGGDASAAAGGRRGPGVLPLLLGGAIAALLGFGAAQYASHGWPFNTGKDQVAALQSQLAAQDKTIAALKAQVAQLGQTAGALPGRLDKLTSDLGQKIAADGKTLSARIQTNTLAIDDLKNSQASASSSQGGGTVPADVTAKIAALDKRVAALESNVKGQIAAAQKVADEEKAKAEAAARQARARGALTAINAALTAGGGYTQPVATLQQDGVTVPPALAGAAEEGVPTLDKLRSDFDPAARKALAVSVRDTMGGGVWGRVKAFFQVQTGARSLTPRSGDSPDAILSRAQAAVDKGDLSGAIETLKSLPKAGQEAMAPWTAKAEIRLKAKAAAKALGAKLDGK